MRCYEVVKHDTQPLQASLAAEELRPRHIVGTRRNGIFKARPKGAININKEVLKVQEERNRVVKSRVEEREKKEEKNKG